MTTLGKILVFLVFLGALAVGGLMVFVAKTTPNWKVAVKERDEYIEVLKANAVAEAESRKKWLQEFESMKRQLDTAVIAAKGTEIKLKRDSEDKNQEAIDARTAAAKSDVNHKLAQAEASRLQQELLFLQGVVVEREKTILAMQEDVVKAKNDAQAAKNAAETMSARLVALLEQIREKEGEIARLSKKGPTGGVVQTVRDSNYSNPPPVKVQGVIEEVDKADKKIGQNLRR